MKFPTLPLLAAAALLAGGLAVARAQQTGPVPPPKRPEDWPGKGIAGVYDLWTQRRTAFWKDRAKDQGAVVFFGDSITQGFNAADAFPGMKTANRGIGSDSSRRLLFRLQEDVLDLHPRAVVILIGINDLAANVPPQDVADNIRGILDAIHHAQPETPVALCRVMPYKRDPGKFPDRIIALNALMDGVATGRPHVAVCDTWTPFATPDGTSRASEFPDHLHPNAAGHKIWAAALRPVLQRLQIINVSAPSKASK